jgi:hypothetical protein
MSTDTDPRTWRTIAMMAYGRHLATLITAGTIRTTKDGPGNAATMIYSVTKTAF